MALPLVILGGYLGAGKTTLLNHLLRHADGRRLAVLVNDFGAISIDADLIESGAGAGAGIGPAGAEVLALAGGCVCCSYGADLVGSLQALAGRTPPPDLVLLECSGVGLPGAVARTAALARGLALAGIVTVVDASAITALLRDGYVGDTVRSQLTQADLLLLNQSDRSDPAGMAAVRALLAAEAPGVAQWPCRHGQVPPELVLGLGAGDGARRTAAQASAASADAAPRLAPPTAAQLPGLRHVSRQFDGPVDIAALVAELTSARPPWLRAKGWVQGLDGQPWLLQAMGRRVDASPAPGMAGRAIGTLVCIAGPA